MWKMKGKTNKRGFKSIVYSQATRISAFKLNADPNRLFAMHLYLPDSFCVIFIIVKFPSGSFSLYRSDVVVNFSSVPL